MGVTARVRVGKFPRQGKDVGREVVVCFNYDSSNTMSGVVVRDDVQEPFLKIIRLKNGRYVLDSECQYYFR